jgi:hypothetical protein
LLNTRLARSVKSLTKINEQSGLFRALKQSFEINVEILPQRFNRKQDQLEKNARLIAPSKVLTPTTVKSSIRRMLNISLS